MVSGFMPTRIVFKMNCNLLIYLYLIITKAVREPGRKAPSGALLCRAGSLSEAGHVLIISGTLRRKTRTQQQGRA